MRETRTHIGILGIFLMLLTHIGLPAMADMSPEKRGGNLFLIYCVTCHGPQGDGKGRAAKNLDVPPGNLQTSSATDQQMEAIIRKGGAAVGRTASMPPWEQELTDQQIKDLVVYLHSLKNKQ